MLNRLFVIFTGLFLSLNVHADSAVIKCEGGLKKFELRFDETSDVTKDTVTFLLDGKKTSLTNLDVTQTEYGILAVTVQHKTGPGKYSYQFKNLGSNKCFGVYGSKQNGLATVEVYNSLGMINKANCDCDQD